MDQKHESFLPDDYVEQRVQRRTNVVLLTLFAVVMAGIVGAFVVSGKRGENVEQMYADVNARFIEAARRLEQLDELQQRKQQMIRKAQVTSVLVERVPRTAILAELINNMPATLSLLEMRLDTHIVKNAPPRTAIEAAKRARRSGDALPDEPQVQPTEVSIDLTGIAPTDVQVAQFMTALSHNEMFTDVNLTVSEEQQVDNRPMRRFRIRMSIAPEADVRKFQPTLADRDLNQNPMSNTVQIDRQGRLVVPTERSVSAVEAAEAD